MKFHAFGLGLVALLGLSTASIGRADTEIWHCDGGNLEGLSVSTGDNGYKAGIAWDCWGGGGICERNVNPVIQNRNGETIVRGTDFVLTIKTGSSPESNGTYPGHISATGEGPSDEGGGLSLDESLSCSRGSDQ